MGGAAIPATLAVALDALVGRAEAAGGRLALAIAHLQRNERYACRADEVFAAASTIKLPILVALYAACAAGRLALQTPVPLVAEDQVTGSGILQVLSPGIALPLRDLAELMIVCSDNAATNMILAQLGIPAVNEVMAGLGMTGSRLLRPLQVIPAAAAGINTVTAADLARLLEAMATGRAVSHEACRRMIATLKRQQINDALPALLPDPHGGPDQPLGALPAWELAHKTGGITGHQHDAGILYLPGQTIVIAALSANCGPATVARALLAQVGLAVFEAYRPGPVP